MFSSGSRKRKRTPITPATPTNLQQVDDICNTSPILTSTPLTPEEFVPQTQELPQPTIVDPLLSDDWILKTKVACLRLADEMIYLLQAAKQTIMNQQPHQSRNSSVFYELCKHNLDWFMDMIKKYKKDKLYFKDLYSYWYEMFESNFVDDLRKDDIIESDDDHESTKRSSSHNKSGSSGMTKKSVANELLVEAREGQIYKYHTGFMLLLDNLHEQFLMKYQYLIMLGKLFVLRHTQYI